MVPRGFNRGVIGDGVIVDEWSVMGGEAVATNRCARTHTHTHKN